METLNKSSIKSVCNILRMDDGVSATNYVEQFSWILFLKIHEEIENQLYDIYKLKKIKFIKTIEDKYKWSNWASKNWNNKSDLVKFINNDLFPYLKNLNGSPEKNKIRDIFKDITNRIDSGGTILDAITILDKIQMDHIQDTHLLSSAYEEIIMESETQGDWSDQIYTPRPIVEFIVSKIKPKIGEKIFDPFAGSCGFLIESYKFLAKENKIGKNEWNILQNNTFFGVEKKPVPYLLGTMNMILHQILVPNLLRANSLDKNVFNIPDDEKFDIIMLNPPFAGREHASVSKNYPIQTKATDGMAIQYTHRHLKPGGRGAIILPDGKILFKDGIYERIRDEWLEKCDVHSVVSLPAGSFTSTGAAIPTKILFFEKKGKTKKVWFCEIDGKFTKKQTIQKDDFFKLNSIFNSKKESEISWIKTIDELKKDNLDLSPKNPNYKNEEKTIDIISADTNLKKLAANNKENIEKYSEFSKNFLKNLNSKKVKFKEVKLEDTCDVLIGGTPKRAVKKYFIGGKNLWASVSELNGNTINDTKEYLTDEGVKNSNVKLLKKGTVLMSFKLSIGKTGICGKDMYTNEAIAAFVPKIPKINPNYILLMVSTISKISKNKKGSLGAGSLNKKKLEELLIPIPITKNDEYSLEHQEYLLNHFEQSKNFKNEIFEQKNTMTELLDNYDNYLLDDLIKG